MLRIFDCLVYDHNLPLVLVAAVICAVGAAAAMMGLGRAQASGRTWFWAGLAGICAAAAIWSTHFLAMLAYLTQVEVHFDIYWTAISFLVGAAPIVCGFGLAANRASSRLTVGAGGALVGLGVVALHYVGMSAVKFAGLTIGFASDLVAVSILLSLVFGIAALICGVVPGRRLIGGLFLIGMTVSLHFTGMGAVVLDLNPYHSGSATGFSREALAIVVVFAALGIVSLAAVLAFADRRHAARMAAEVERFRTLADGAFEGVVIQRDGVIMDMNPAFREIFALNESRNFESLHDLISPNALRNVMEARGAPLDLELTRADGEALQVEACGRAIRLADGEYGELISVRDVSARKNAEAQLSHLAMHDQVTDLANRRLFMELAERHLAHAKRHGEQFAIHLIDLDGFKMINDTHGHAAGDALLRALGGRLTAALREEDVIARFGGDEFAIVETGASQPTDAIVVADRVLSEIGRSVKLPDGEALISASIGVAVYPDDGQTIDELIRNADTAMYRAKAEGKGGYRFFELEMDAAMVERRLTEQRLRRAIADGALSVAYQPLVDSRTREPLGFEALLRWTDPELGRVSPEVFIPIAEESGLIIPLGKFVLRRACADAASWPDHLRVAVNLSAVQFRRQGLVDTVRSALLDAGLPGERLDLEITESILIDNRELVLTTLSELRAMDIRISMDDFGTGYSSLSYLLSFPFDKIKIDRVFVTDLNKKNRNASIVQAVVAMGRSLSMRVVAEGVETSEEADVLHGMECDELQGYLISKPMQGDAVQEFLRETAAAPAEERSVA